MTTPDDRALATQTAAPPVGPPKRPVVGIAMADDGFEDLRRAHAARGVQLQAMQVQLDATLQQLQAAIDEAKRRRADA